MIQGVIDYFEPLSFILIRNELCYITRFKIHYFSRSVPCITKLARSLLEITQTSLEV